jgi:hypothetical protein
MAKQSGGAQVVSSLVIVGGVALGGYVALKVLPALLGKGTSGGVMAAGGPGSASGSSMAGSNSVLADLAAALKALATGKASKPTTGGGGPNNAGPGGGLLPNLKALLGNELKPNTMSTDSGDPVSAMLEESPLQSFLDDWLPSPIDNTSQYLESPEVTSMIDSGAMETYQDDLPEIDNSYAGYGDSMNDGAGEYSSNVETNLEYIDAADTDGGWQF